eukprot:TRINITY_DN18239_c0_g5_i1.p1 TRINITY_DN18239_c0_g5~~TRINITY_DN18239_c0_g5_i1.p1  ORF type:complete len:1675 (-),score=293.08 TRINITY_DN18239_c0_g5_i1:142-5031(-)
MASAHWAFEDQAARTPEAVAAICRGRSRVSLTYAALSERSVLLARGLARKASSTEVSGTSQPPVVAIQLARTHPDFVPALLAASRCGLPFVLLSTDLPDRSLQDERNALVMRLLEPALHIVESPRAGAVCIDDLVHESRAGEAIPISRYPIDASPFCYMFTGGTQRTKVVEVTHAMLLHERVAYTELWQPRSRVVVLAHTSVYWGASALGQLSIALAFGGTIVWTDATEIADLRRCIEDEGVTVLGLVPDHLDLLAPQAPALELPFIEAVFTWGERLPHRVADRWRNHPRATLYELLIATEYWLSLWANPLGDGVLRIVRGTELLILNEEDGNRDAELGEVGELCIAGPMVTSGYRTSGMDGSNGALSSETFYVTDSGQRFFRTHDLVRRVPGGIVYKGRADMMAKDKGKWVDMFAVEENISRVESVRAAKIVPDPSQEHFHAFVVLDERAAAGKALDAVRLVLPARVQLWQVPELPRHPVTRKVNAARLLRLVNRPVSWPLEDGRLATAPARLQARIARKFYRQVKWTAFAVGTAWVFTDRKQLLSEALLAAVALSGSSLVCGTGDYLGGQRKSAGFAVLWLAVSILRRPYCFAQFGRFVSSLTILTYGWLALIYVDDARNRSTFAKLIMSFCDQLPFWKAGLFLFLSAMQHLPGPLGIIFNACLSMLGASGAVIAARRGRLLAWPLIFWSIGIGHQLDHDCGSWMHWQKWQGHIMWKASQLHELVSDKIEGFLARFRRAPVAASNDMPKDVDSVATVATVATEDVAQSSVCSQCGGHVASLAWCGRDDSNQPLCTKCGNSAAAISEEVAAAWFAEHATEFASIAARSNGHESSERKRRLSEPSDAGEVRRRRTGSDHDESMPEANGSTAEAGRGSEEVAEQEDSEEDKNVGHLERAWWYNHTSDNFDVSAEKAARAAEVATGAPALEHDVNGGRATRDEIQNYSPELQQLCAILGEVEPLIRPVRLDTVLLGLDSLRIARLGNAVRSKMGRSLSALQLRAAKTVCELDEAVASAERVEQRSSKDAAAKALASKDASREYAVWYSPGQYSPMGHWVLRSDEALDRPALESATRSLVERHAALRVCAADALRYMSFLFDAASLFTLYAPMLNAGPFPLPWIRARLSACFECAWPRVVCRSREEMYGKRCPGVGAPLEVVRCRDGQDDFEHALKGKRYGLVPPGAITVYELECHLADAWKYHRYNGRFVIMKVPEGAPASCSSKLAYVDATSGEWGPLLSPACEGWQIPPYGFPALFFVPLSSGAKAWLRLERGDELRVCYREAPRYAGAKSEEHHLCAFRASGTRERLGEREPVVINFLGVCMLHAFADGNCYLPLVQDFLTFYDEARGRPVLALPPLGNPFAELERRLFDTFHCRPSPLRSSLRGSIFRYKERGYGHDLGLMPGAMEAIAAAASRYRVPLDTALLGMVTCALARADGVDTMEFTLYAPMRDGPEDAMGVGLFSDWRDLALTVDFDLATTLGVILQASHKIAHRQWSVFNALRKPDRKIVNIQPLDFGRRAGFVNLGENLWHGGDRLHKQEPRPAQLSYAQQEVTVVIEQQDELTWWILMSAGHDKRPTAWMRRFVYAFGAALDAFLLTPLAPVHRPLPNDAALLRYFEEGTPIPARWR